jgi:hypothetical protein
VGVAQERSERIETAERRHKPLDQLGRTVQRVGWYVAVLIRAVNRARRLGVEPVPAATVASNEGIDTATQRHDIQAFQGQSQAASDGLGRGLSLELRAGQGWA